MPEATPRRRPRVLVVSQYYEPAFVGGTVVDARGAVEVASSIAETWILAGDRERDGSPCHAATPGRWVDHPSPLDGGNAVVRYESLGALPLRAVADAVRSAHPELIVLFSMWAPGSLACLLLRRVGRLGRPAPRVILVPAGELFPGALAKGRRKKQVVGALCRRLGLWRGVTWRATDEVERAVIRGRLPGATVQVAGLVPAPPLAAPTPPRPGPRAPLRLVSFATLAENKGLDVLLDHVAAAARAGLEVELHAYGSAVDPAYRDRCLRKASTMPPGASVRIGGVASRDRVAEELAWADAFVLATASESFGVAILEALDAGRPIVIGDRTPWRDLRHHGCGWDLDRSDTAAWVVAFRELADADEPTRLSWHAASLARARSARTEALTAARAWSDLLGVQ